MKMPFAISMILSGVMLGAAPFAALAEDDVEAECRRAAQEEGVPSDEIEDFVAECLAATGAGAESESE